jgi:primosomal protein N''
VLDALYQHGQARHQAIFKADAGFNTSSRHFQPYVHEIAESIPRLEQVSKEEQQHHAEVIFKQLILLLKTIKGFEDSL